MTEPVALLIVDDRPQDLLAITAVLEPAGYTLVTAVTGADALRRLLERDFAAILLDVMLPDLQGFEVARIIKQRPRSRHTPIVFLTANGDDVAMIYRGYQVGAVDYLAKPIDPDILRAKIATFAELFRKDRRIKQQAEALRAADRRERELELAALQVASQRRYRNFAEAVPQMVWTADPGGAATYFNHRWYDFTGQSPEGAAGAGWLDAVHPSEVEGCRTRWADARAAGRVLELECRLRRRDGAYLWHLCRTVPERGEDGAIVAWLGTFTDFDERRRAFDEAQAAIAARDEFLSIASHELRTPLMTLQLRLQTLDSVVGASDERARALVGTAARQATRLMSLVTGLLDVSRITSGHLTLSRERFDLADATREVVERFREAAAEAGCTLALGRLDPVSGDWDRLRVEQVVTNLISNAVKYAAGAPVEIAVHADGDTAALMVRDHGPGIASGEAIRIFERFERGGAAAHLGGLGLGLYIAREIMAAHGGGLRVTATPGGGATFWCELPRAPPAPATSCDTTGP